jgi:hypothetical protein
MINTWALYRITYSKIIELQIELGRLESIAPVTGSCDYFVYLKSKTRVLDKILALKKDMKEFEDSHPLKDVV